jgi:hypothetical protein
MCRHKQNLKEEGVSFDVLKGCVPVDGDTYDIPNAVLKEADIPATTYGKRESNHSRLNNDLGKPDDPATQELYNFLNKI